jgi:hypothetical protein
VIQGRKLSTSWKSERKSRMSEEKQDGKLSLRLSVTWVDTPGAGPLVSLYPPYESGTELRYINLYPREALSLLAWLRQEEARIRELVQEEEES